MLCDKYKDALSEAAASSAPLPSGVSQHTSSCAHCRELFAAQQSVFALVDAGLRSRANAVVPGNFEHRVRAALQAEAVQDRKHGPAVLTWCSLAAAMLMAILLTLNLKHGGKEAGATYVVESKLLTSPQAPVHSGKTGSVGLDMPARPYSRGGGLRTSQQPKASVRRQDEPEVLVPQGQEELLAKYMQGMATRRPRVTFSAGLHQEENTKAVEVPSIEISELVVTPLSDLSSN
ncbi:MAG TPA: hypothetical protein VNY81_06000 [Candidatus Saccharimonadales bacterium]|jgi:hypothetical protein|nr:hypothetical protein [Candidatus Saccharimonadales bacterium]